MRRIETLCIVLIALLTSTTLGQFRFEDNFDQYATDAEFQSVWQADLGDGNMPTGGPIGILVPRDVPPFPPAPIDNPPDIQGQGIAFNEAGGINEIDLINVIPDDLILLPTEIAAIRYGGDIFDDGEGNKRVTIGLRNDTVDRDPDTFGLQAGINFIELGYWNADVCDPTDPACDPGDPGGSPSGLIETTGFAYRVILFGGIGGDLVRQPNWQYFPLDLELDTNDDGVVNPLDYIESWHRFSATVTQEDVTLELDLERDGTIDSSVTWEMTLNADPANGEIPPFTSLRMGGASGVTMNGLSVVDNVFVEMAGIQTCGDFDMDGDVDVADRTIQTVNWTGAGNVPDPPKTFADGDCDGDSDVDVADQTGTIQHWTGAMAGNLTDGADADLGYDPATGRVILDASDTASGQFISFVFATNQDNMRPENAQFPFINTGTNTDAQPFQIGQTDALNLGAGPRVELGDIFPTGLTLDGLAEYLTLAEYASELGTGGTFDLRLIPEPSSAVLIVIGTLFVLARNRRRRG